MEVKFTHPRSSLVYSADVSENLQVGQALLALQGPDTGPFLTPPLPGEQDTVYLERTKKSLPLSTTMGEAGVVDGDVLQIYRMGQGA
jgi:hypothetical protein